MPRAQPRLDWMNLRRVVCMRCLVYFRFMHCSWRQKAFHFLESALLTQMKYAAKQTVSSPRAASRDLWAHLGTSAGARLSPAAAVRFCTAADRFQHAGILATLRLGTAALRGLPLFHGGSI